jgi:RRXRR protein
MSHVFVLDTNKQPLPPVHSGWARILLTRGKAAVFRRYPFTIILKEALPAPQAQGLQLKIDPGSKMTGLAIVNDMSGEVIWAAELSHRGEAIKKAVDGRRRTGAPVKEKPQDPLPETPILQSSETEELASAIQREPRCQYPHLGASPDTVLPDHHHLPGTRQVRYATDAEPGD